MATTDIEQVNKAIYKKLTGITELVALVGNHPRYGGPQIFLNSAPQESKLPLCIYTFMGGTPNTGGGAKKIFSKLSYSIKLVNSGTSISPLLSVYTRLEQEFQQDQTIEDEVFIGMQITNYILYSEENVGIRYNHLGIQISLMAYNAIP